MKLLALEFSSAQRSVAVVSSLERGTIRELRTPSPMADSEIRVIHPYEAGIEIIEATPGNSMKPLGLVEEALKQAGLEREQIECVAVGLGPGSYTGVRVAIALAQGWQLARGVKLLGISSSECIAAEAQRSGLEGQFCVVVDAQRGEFYLAVYEIGATGLCEIQPLKIVPMADVREREKAGAVIVGPEVARWFTGGRSVFPRAAMLGRLALGRRDFVRGHELEPIYLRETRFVKAPPVRRVQA